MQTQSRRALFNRDHARTLTQVQITATSPGTILHDFDVLLDMLRQGPLRLTESTQQPSRTLLSKINARLAHPVQLGLKNPQLKSYPPIMGLYLLLRASGLTTVGGTSQKPLLFLDADLDREWQALNPTEQYGSLLEIWLLRAESDILGERFLPGLSYESYLYWIDLIGWNPGEGAQASNNADLASATKYVLGWHNLGIMELFGFIAVTEDPPQPGLGRQIHQITPMPLGTSLLALLEEKYYSRLEPSRIPQGSHAAEAGTLQPILEPYWPQWKRTLRVPQWTFRPGTHVFDMKLDRLWARLALPGGATLDDLATTILNVLEFDFDHLYEFGYRNRFGIPWSVGHPMLEESPSTAEVRVGDLPLPLGQTLTFIYDFGDWWEIHLTLTGIDTAPVTPTPIVLEKKGQPPSQYPYYDDEYEPDEDFDEDQE